MEAPRGQLNHMRWKSEPPPRRDGLASLDEGAQEAAAVLREALEAESALAREHAAWALGRID